MHLSQGILKSFSAKISESGIDTNKLITLNSWIHGLNTTLGQSFENVANILCDGDKENFQVKRSTKCRQNKSAKL